MYFQYFQNNFLLNLLPSLIFLIFIFICSFQFAAILKKKKFIFFDNSPFIIFVFLIALFTIIFNYLILFNYISIAKNCIYLLIAILFFFSFINQYNSKKIKLELFIKKNNLNSTYILKILIIIIFFFISILPLSDADSVVTHLYFPIKILTDKNLFLEFPKDVELLSYLNSEIILIFSGIFRSDNFGSQLNFFSLLISFFLLKKKNFNLILLSCPLIIFFISTQKLQLFFGLIYLFIAIFIFNFKIKNKIEIFIVCFLLIFYSSGKIYYFLFAMPLFFVFILKNKKFIFNIIFFSFISFLLVLFPILLKKFIYFSNPFAPFFFNFFNQGNEFYKIISLSLRSSEGWFGNSFDINYLLRPFIPTSLSNLSSTLGPVFIFLLINFNEIKKIYFIPYILIFFILSTGQILPRYYFESFLILSYFVFNKSIIINFICKIQLIIVFIISLIFFFIAYFQTNIFFSKDEFMKRFSFLYDSSKQILKFNLTGNILNLEHQRESIFLPTNYYGARYLNAVDFFYGKEEFNKELIQFINNYNIKYIINNPKIYLPSCIETRKINTFSYNNVKRNFLIEQDVTQVQLNEIIGVNCDNNSK
jgi:hypothetical protein